MISILLRIILRRGCRERKRERESTSENSRVVIVKQAVKEEETEKWRRNKGEEGRKE
jgi:hypothetical protein